MTILLLAWLILNVVGLLASISLNSGLLAGLIVALDLLIIWMAGK